ncbi:RluA family pseudouridine synthase [Tengunoibacter tsumagoiensis]|uniref:Pseudouridine synthase n=1 Tax=Tengunoibacter tsumagoiensis TaxID=2014871 RepID=A0A402A1B7_9CHLR|nr:RluA family pseudouridine synthase [Tengunoibacter tsumagoiensis]GCE12938.1 putative RNA pseudouridine synthase [Tengunoibacter tsumagoiensis]
MQNPKQSTPTVLDPRQAEIGQTWTIESEQAGQRLDRFLTTLIDGVSRTGIQQLITEGSVLVNEKKSKPGYALRVNDSVHLLTIIAAPVPREIKPLDLTLDIVYEDTDLLIVNKPAGLVVHPAPGHYDDTLVNALVAHYPELQSALKSEIGPEAEIKAEIPGESDEMQGEEGLRPGIVHRLDRDTSGLIIVAKNLATQTALIEQMKRHEIEKRYLALVEGIVSLDRGSIDAPIGRDQRHRQQMTITVTEGREARTHFRVVERFTRHTLLLLQLETGRTHQIRVHLKAINHPIVGDPMYGSGRMQPDIELHRQFLHAYQLRFTHPISGKLIDVEAPVPADLQAVIDKKEVL